MNYFRIIIIIIITLCIALLLPKYWILIPAIIDTFLFEPVAENRPIIWHKPDDLGYNDITINNGGGFANGRIKTPNIDSIGKNGVRFNNAYSGQATCAPSRAALLTGKFPTKIGFEFTPITQSGSFAISFFSSSKLKGKFNNKLVKYVNESIMKLPDEIPTFGEIFQSDPEHNYRTLFLGKWHNGHTSNYTALTKGFDEKLAITLISLYLPIGHPDSIDCPLDDMLDRYLRANIRYHIEKDSSPHFKPNGYLTDYIGDEAVNAIEANKDHPFLMYVAFTAPHTPLQALKSDYESLSYLTDLDHCSKVYGAMLISLDRSVGKILNSLEKNGLTNNTLVIFSSDNGAPNYINFKNINSPYRGWKASYFEGGIKVPLLMKWPNKIQSGQVINDIVSHVDIFPTIINAANLNHYQIIEDDIHNNNNNIHNNINERNNHYINGINLLPFITKQQKEESESNNNDNNNDNNNLKKEIIHKYLFWRSGNLMALRYYNYKLIVSEHPNKKWLFNLHIDPTEQINLANNETYGIKLNELLEKIYYINSTQVSPLWPALSETPILIDKIALEPYKDGDEYTFWSN